MTEMRQLGRYQIQSPLGSGAYADVYRALDTALNRTVALKVLKAAYIADPEAFQRFVQEAQVAAGLFHPHIATALDIGQAQGFHYLAMRYVDGMALDKLVQQRGALPWDEALQIIEQVAGALEFAHRKGLVHRDVKPQNIIVSPSEGAVLTDFGLVKALMSSGMQTRSGALIGTPQYMAPELWRGQPAVPATDQYALACVLVELLAGCALFDAPTPPAVMLKHFQPPELPASLPEVLKPALLKALDQEPGARYETLTAFLAALQPAPKAPAGIDWTQKAREHFERGKAFYKAEDYDQAIEAYTQAIQLDPEQAEYYYERGESYFGKRDYDRCIADDTKAIELDPDNGFYYQQRGNVYTWKKDYDRAIADYNHAIQLDPGKADYYWVRGKSYGWKNDHDRAITDYSKAIQLDPENGLYYQQRGVSYHEQGDYDRAIADYTKAIQLDPDKADYYYSRGLSYHAKRDYDRAIVDKSKAIQLDPDKADYYYSRGLS